MTVASIIILNALLSAGLNADPATTPAVTEEPSERPTLMVVAADVDDPDANASIPAAAPVEDPAEDRTRSRDADASRAGGGSPDRPSEGRWSGGTAAAIAATTTRTGRLIGDYGALDRKRSIADIFSDGPPKASSSKNGFWGKSSGRKSLRFGRRGIGFGIPIPAWLMVVLAPVGLAVMVVGVIAKFTTRPSKPSRPAHSWPSAAPRRRP